MVLSAAVDVNTTIPQALVNTGIGMGTVFLVLILISFIIYLLGFVPNLLYRENKKKSGASEKAPEQTVNETKPETNAVSLPEKGSQTDNEQLAAVIAAAIAAQLQEETGVPVPADGFMIRSIKKRTFSL